MRLFKRAPRVYELDEPRRLPVVTNEPPLREHIMHPKALEIVLERREFMFQNTPQIKRLTNSGKRV